MGKIRLYVSSISMPIEGELLSREAHQADWNHIEVIEEKRNNKVLREFAKYHRYEKDIPEELFNKVKEILKEGEGE